ADQNHAWAHLRLGNLYAAPPKLYRRDAMKEWDTAFALEPGLKNDHAFHKSLCEGVDSTERDRVKDFFERNLGADRAPVLLLPCIRAALDAKRLENAARLIEEVSGAERPERGLAAVHLLDLPTSTCAQKRTAVGIIVAAHYGKARGVLQR